MKAREIGFIGTEQEGLSKLSHAETIETSVFLRMINMRKIINETKFENNQ